VITLEQYFQKPRSSTQESAARDLLERVDRLLQEAVLAGAHARHEDPDTGSEISGSKGGDGDGGFRTPGTRTGGPGSAHRAGQAVDVYDPDNALDTWLDAFEHDGENTKLEEHGLYREHPEDTVGWCHLQSRAPGSGRRTFRP
jgi:hypothetical protein